MAYKRLAIDIDEVVFPLIESFKDIIAKKHGILNLPAPRFYSLERSWSRQGITTAIKESVFRQFFACTTVRQTHFSLNPHSGATETLKNLNKLGYEIYFLTARSIIKDFVGDKQYKATIKATEEWVKRHFPFARGVIYSNDKIEYASDFICLLDDYGRLCQNWIEAGGQAVLYHRPWNTRYHARNWPVFKGWLNDNLLNHIQQIETSLQGQACR